jgi:hypothetical protein
MRRQIHQVPTNLPHACLYLDDIETITGILGEAVSEAQTTRSAKVLAKGTVPVTSSDVKAVYRVGADEMDSIDDLLEQGGSLTNFELRVSGGDRSWPLCELVFNWFSKPRLHLSGIRDEWEVYAKIRAVFEKRRSVVKNLVDELPGWAKFGGWALFTVGSAFAFLLKGAAHEAFDMVNGVAFSVFIFCLVALVRPNRIRLVRSHERSRAKSEAIKKYALAAGLFTLGGCFTKLLDYLYSHYVK